MIWNDITFDLSNKMTALLMEAEKKGCYFSFETLTKHATEYRRDDVITIYSDDMDFGFEVIERKDNEK